MTMNDFQRAALAMFAAMEAGPRASVDQMKAIAMCIRNRVRQGWHEGDWLKVLEHASEVSANEEVEYAELDGNDRNLQILVRDIDEIYFSRRDYEKDPSRAAMPELDEAVGKACYWAFIDRPFSEWFKKNIIEDPAHHPQHSSMGLMFFYE